MEFYIWFVLLKLPLPIKLNTEYNFSSVWVVIMGILNSDYTILWFVKNLIIFTFFSPVFYCFLKNKIIGILLIVISVLLNIFVKFDYSFILSWLPMYITGAYIALHFPKYIDIKNRYEVLPNTYIIVGELCLFICLFFPAMPFYDIIFFIWRFLSPFLLLFIYDVLNKIFEFRTHPFYKYSFWIYCTHFILITGSQKLIYNLFGVGILTYICLMLIIPLCVLTFLIWAASFLDKRVNPLYKILTGNR